MTKLPLTALKVEFTGIELKDYFDRFGHTFWNDTENIICIPLNKINSADLMSKYEMYFGISKLDFDYIIIHI